VATGGIRRFFSPEEGRTISSNHDVSRCGFLKVGAAAAGLIGLGGPAVYGASQTVKKGGVLRYPHNTDFLNFHPTQLPAGNFAMLYSLYDNLIGFDEKYKATPLLAESWEFADGGRRLTMKLRKGVIFHTGRDFTANDVVFTPQRFQDKEVGADLRAMSLYIKGAKGARQAHRQLLHGEAQRGHPRLPRLHVHHRQGGDQRRQDQGGGHRAVQARSMDARR
jgi:hypothetical protein